MRDTSDACIQSMHEVLLFNRIFNACSMTKGHWYEIKKENYWSFRMTSDVTCLETYKHINTMHCSLHRSLDFASSRILPKTCPALSWDQALLSFSWVNRFQAGKANWKVHPFIVQYLCTCNAHSRDYRGIKEGLRGHIPCILVVQHGNSKNVDSFGKNLATEKSVAGQE